MMRVYAVFAAAAWLAGCGGSLPDAFAGNAPPDAVSRASAKAQNLLYVSDVGTDDVYVYSYPQGKLVETLTGFHSPVRVCSDGSGNVYVTNTNAQTILEYAHGGKNPIATFADPGFEPVDCSVDPKTGTLAVTNYGPSGSNTGSLALFPKSAEAAKIVHVPNFQGYLFCAYDTAGNLYLEGLNYSYGLIFAELPAGKQKFASIVLKQLFPGWGGIEWDGQYLAVGDGISTIYDFAIKGRKGAEVRTITLKRAINVVQFWLQGSTLIAPNGPNGAKHEVGFWKYPGGGDPTRTIGGLQHPSGATISVAP